MKRAASALLASLAAAALGCGDDAVPAATPQRTGDPCRPAPPDDLETPAIHTPRWAFEPWISKDISTTGDTYAFVAGFRERGIPVGVVVLDSPWETHYNTFVPSPSRYPDFGGMVADLAADDIRVVLWMTQMVNSTGFDFEDGGDTYEGPAPNLEEGLACDFFINDGQQFGWWKGLGAALDFFDPHATSWWHRQQDPLFALGVSGFKLDFGDSYVRADTVETDAGTVPHQQYSEAYYEDFYRYGVAARGREDFVTMVRPWDASYDFEGRFFARKEHAPVAWVGDNRRDFVGLSDALDHVFRSAEAGYVVVGSDIGGYLDRDDITLEPVPFDLDAFARWTAVGALMPFMELHGRANLAPWTVPESPDEMVAIYRYWATLHHELVPFFYSLAEEAYAAGGPMLHPVGVPESWPGDYRYLIGEAFLVAPPIAAAPEREVELPAGARWYDWWSPDADPLDGGQTLTVSTADRARIPLFVREGAIVPLSVSGDVTGLGTAASAGHRTVLVYPGEAPSSFTVHDEDGALTAIEAELEPGGASVRFSRAATPLLIRVRAETPATGVSGGGASLPALSDRAALDAATQGWFAEPATRSTWIKLPASARPIEIAIAAP